MVNAFMATMFILVEINGLIQFKKHRDFYVEYSRTKKPGKDMYGYVLTETLYFLYLIALAFTQYWHIGAAIITLSLIKSTIKNLKIPVITEKYNGVTVIRLGTRFVDALLSIAMLLYIVYDAAIGR